MVTSNCSARIKSENCVQNLLRNFLNGECSFDSVCVCVCVCVYVYVCVCVLYFAALSGDVHI